MLHTRLTPARRSSASRTRTAVVAGLALCALAGAIPGQAAALPPGGAGEVEIDDVPDRGPVVREPVDRCVPPTYPRPYVICPVWPPLPYPYPYPRPFPDQPARG